MILHGDCLEEMRKMDANSISAIVTDPPYGLHFMGKSWDKFNKLNFDERGTHKYLKNSSIDQRSGFVRRIGTGNSLGGTYDDKLNDEFQSFITQFGSEALRIMKPGGHILMFGAPRRYHRQVCGLEDSGFEIRDCLMWIFGSGFPKSHNHFGLEGFGTALKPAYEPIIMAMKPCDGTFKQNAEKWGQAGINIDGCRVETGESTLRPNGTRGNQYCGGYSGVGVGGSLQGRWPANVILDEESAEMLDEQSGILKSGGGDKRGGCEFFMKGDTRDTPTLHKANSGGASRFFYCAKASSSERNEGLECLPEQSNMRVNAPRESELAKFATEVKNNHPTVKPLKLMEYLIKLVMPPKDGVLLDPFAGSGTTILAARRLGYTAIGIEKEQQYCEIARARIAQVEAK